MTLPTIDLASLGTVTGGIKAPATKPVTKPASTAKPLKAHRIGNTKVINNQSLDDMFWEVKPF
jgi:hypothetical protein